MGSELTIGDAVDLSPDETSFCVRWGFDPATIARELAVGHAIGDHAVDLVGARDWPVLEVGSGAGAVLERLLPRLDHGRLVASDADPRRLAHARSRLAGDWSAVAGDASDLPLRSRSFALVLLPRVLHVVPRPTRALREAARVLAADGSVAIYYTEPDAHDAIAEAMAPLFPRREPGQRQRLGDSIQSIADRVPELQLSTRQRVATQMRSESPASVARSVKARIDRGPEPDARTAMIAAHRNLLSIEHPFSEISRPLGLYAMTFSRTSNPRSSNER